MDSDLAKIFVARLVSTMKELGIDSCTTTSLRGTRAYEVLSLAGGQKDTLVYLGGADGPFAIDSVWLTVDGIHFCTSGERRPATTEEVAATEGRTHIHPPASYTCAATLRSGS